MNTERCGPARGPDTQGPPGLRRQLPSPRITAELREEGGRVVNHKRVARIMRTIGRRTEEAPRTRDGPLRNITGSRHEIGLPWRMRGGRSVRGCALRLVLMAALL
ncbi:transposase [Streptomyces sp. XY332]|uniref:transposase n=1 Tax=Streptomyces sp. XY332 TaxID=1415561 RepID=UPI003B637C9D